MKKGSIRNVRRDPPVRRLKDEDGLPIEYPLCPLLHMKMVDPSGNVVDIPVSTGPNSVNANPYYLFIVKQKKDKGFLPYYECPSGVCKSEGPDVLGAWKYSDIECCSHMHDLIMRRRKRHEAKQAEVERTLNQKTEQQMRMLFDMAVQANKAAAEPAPRPKRSFVKDEG